MILKKKKKNCNCWDWNRLGRPLKILESVEEGLLNKLEITAIASRRKLRLPKKKIYKNTIILNDANKILDFENYDILVELIEKGLQKRF